MRLNPSRLCACAAAALTVGFLIGCDPPLPDSPGDDALATASASPASRLSEVRFWTYQIGGLFEDGAVDALVASAYDLLVLEPTRSDRDATEFNAAEMVSRLHASDGSRPGFKKIVAAYIDIGEAEDWRTYWQSDWVAPRSGEPGEPSFLLTIDPDGWSGNYPVAYWDDRWKEIIIHGENSVLQQVLDDGFDGIYMDWVEAYSDVHVMAAADAAGRDPKSEMIEFIREIRAFARAQNPDFYVIPQNASEIAVDVEDEYFAIIDAIGQEQIYFDGNADTDWDAEGAGDIRVPDVGVDEDDGYNRAFYEATLEPFLAAGLPVFSVDYARLADNASEAYDTASAKGYVPYVSQRSLDRLTDTPPPGYPGDASVLP